MDCSQQPIGEYENLVSDDDKPRLQCTLIKQIEPNVAAVESIIATLA